MRQGQDIPGCCIREYDVEGLSLVVAGQRSTALGPGVRTERRLKFTRPTKGRATSMVNPEACIHRLRESSPGL